MIFYFFCTLNAIGSNSDLRFDVFGVLNRSCEDILRFLGLEELDGGVHG